MAQFSDITYVDVKMTRPDGCLLLEETKRFFFETDNEGLIFSDYAKEQGGEIVKYGSFKTGSVEAAKASLQMMWEGLRVVPTWSK